MKLSIYLIFSLMFPITTHGALNEVKEYENPKIDQIKEINELDNVDLIPFITSTNKRIQQLEESAEKEKFIILQREDSILKDFVYPFYITLFSAILGGFVGYLGMKKRDTEEVEKTKIYATNKVLVEALDCFQDLKAIKRNYIKMQTNNPLARLFSIPPILMVYRHSNAEINKLGYLAKSNSAYLAHLIKTFSQYNTVNDMWKLRNDLVIPIKEREDILDKFIEKKDLNLKELQELIGKIKLAQLVDLNEKILDITDRLLIEFHKILTELPKLTENQIKKKALKEYGEILKYHEERENLDYFLSKVIPVDNVRLKAVTKFNSEPAA